VLSDPLMTKDQQNSEPITLLLHEWGEGNQDALDELMPYVYNELRRRAAAYMKHERSEHTLQITALINETYIELVDKVGIKFEDRNHFFAVAAKVMRRILVDYARRKKSIKRGGGQVDVPLDEAAHASKNESQVDLVVLDEVLNRMAQFDERLAKVVELKYFGGMTLEETAAVLSVSPTTVKRDWGIAKAWLRSQLK